MILWFFITIHVIMFIAILAIAYSMRSVNPILCAEQLKTVNSALVSEMDKLKIEISSLQCDIHRFVDENTFLRRETVDLAIRVDNLQKFIEDIRQ